MSLVTRCPACSTRFKVVPDQIRIAAGWVRCGQCGVVFDASAQLLPHSPAAAAATPPTTAAVSTSGHTAPADPGSAPQNRAEEPARAVAATPTPEPPETPAESPTALPPSREDALPASPLGRDPPERDEPSEPQAEFETTPPEAMPARAPSLQSELAGIVARRAHGGATAAWPSTESGSTPQKLRSTPVSLPPHLRALPKTMAPARLSDEPLASTWPPSVSPALDTGSDDGSIIVDTGALEARLPPIDTAPPEVQPSFVTTARRRAFWAARPVRALLWLGLLLLAAGLLLQWAVSQRDWLAARQPALAPALNTLCAPLGCRIQPYRQLDAIVIDSSAFNRVSGEQFRFSVGLRNTATLPVASPALELTLTDRDNRPLVRRVLTPAQLGLPPALAAQGESSIEQTLTVTDPADPNAVVGYRLTALYP